MNTNYLNIDRRTFYISFTWKNTDGKFIFQNGESLVKLLKLYDSKGIDFIKEFNPQEGKFKRVSKKDLLTVFSWETETSIFLKDHFYFKNA